MTEFEGLRERDFLLLLSFDSTHASHRRAEKIDYKVNGRKRKYTPDFVVTYQQVDESSRRTELCEIKARSVLRKRWAEHRVGFRAAQAYCRERGWRFRLITEKDIPRVQLKNLHFVAQYRDVAASDAIATAIRSLVANEAELAAEEIVQRVAAQGHDALETTSQLWRLVARQELSIDFSAKLSMASRIKFEPWSVANIRFQRHEKDGTTATLETPAFHEMAKQSIRATGPAVVEYVPGKVYGRTDRPGFFTLVQLEDGLSGTVREHGSNALELVPLAHLKDPRHKETDAERTLPDNSSKEDLQVAERRYKAIVDFVDRRRVAQEQAAAAAKKCGVATKTWRGWLRAYQRNPVLSSLLRQKRSDIGNGRFADLESLIDEYVRLWATSNARMKSVHRDLGDEIKRRNKLNPKHPHKIPGYTTFLYRCRNLSRLELETLRSGKRLANLQHALDEGSLVADSPLHIVQIDHTPLPVQVVDEERGIAIGRPILTVLIDIDCRVVPGFYLTFEAPSSLSVGMAITSAVLPKDEILKRHGLPTDAWPVSGLMRVLHADNAGEFHGNVLDLACQEYLIELHWRKVKQPNYGAYIESYLGSLSEKLREVPGSTLGGPDELGDRDPQAEATMTLAQLEKWLLWLLVEYHNSPHSGLNDQTPFSRWKEGFRGTNTRPGIGKVRIPSDVAKFRINFLPLEERVVGTKGILWDYIHYSHPALQRWVNARDPKNQLLPRQFLVRRDPRDLSRIYFWDPERREHLIIPYRNAANPAISLWEHKATRDFITANYKRDVDEELLFEAREQRRRIVREANTQTAIKRRAVENERQRAAAAGAETLYRDISPEPPAKPPVTPSSRPNDPYDDSDIESYSEASV